MARPRTRSGLAYLRPETAQGIFINYRNVLQTSRKKIPFGIGQIGKSFRNEITPGNFIFRTREFEQMEMEFFVEPGTDEEWHEKWIETRLAWHAGLGLSQDNLRLYNHPEEKRSHYSKGTIDIEYRFGFPVPSGASSRAWPTAPTSTSARTTRPPARTCPTSTRRRARGTSRT